MPRPSATGVRSVTRQPNPQGRRKRRENGDSAETGVSEDAGTVEKATVRELIEERLDAEEFHGMSVTKRSGDTVYVVVARTTTMEAVETAPDMDIPIADLRTVVVDLEDQQLTVGYNGLWLPADSDVGDTIVKLTARLTSDLSNGEAVGEPLSVSAVEGLDPDLLLDREIEAGRTGRDVDRMEREPGVDPSRGWGYGGGPPSEVDAVIDRLEEVGLEPTNHLIRLAWGKKVPYDSPREPVDDLESLAGNYGIEPQPGDAGLVAIDVDYPEHFPEVELPESFEVSSPHGDDERRHILLYCEDKRAISDHLGGVWSTQSADWGDLWLGSRYTVGPGSQLSAYGCDNEDYQEGEPGACERCSDPDTGYYRIVNDAPIATVEADSVIDLLPDDPRDDIEADEDNVNDLIESHVRCDRCEQVIHEDDAETVELPSKTLTKCAEGCDE